MRNSNPSNTPTARNGGAVLKIECKIKRESDRAILVTVTDGETTEDIWFPLSQVVSIHHTYSVVTETLDSIVVSQWIAKQKGLT